MSTPLVLYPVIGVATAYCTVFVYNYARVNARQRQTAVFAPLATWIIGVFVTVTLFNVWTSSFDNAGRLEPLLCALLGFVAVILHVRALWRGMVRRLGPYL